MAEFDNMGGFQIHIEKISDWKQAKVFMGVNDIAKDKEIPFLRIGRQIRFMKEELDKWLLKHTGNY